MAGKTKFTNIDFQKYIKETGEKVIAGIVSCMEHAKLIQNDLYEKGYMDVIVFHIKVPECFKDWAVK